MYISFQSLQQLDTLSAGRIESPDDAKTYVRKAAALCGITDLSLAPDDIESRLAAAERDAAKDPNKLLSDDQVAEAFNFMSDEFQVAHPAHLTASDILEYRSVMASIFPHMFSPKTVGGSRPAVAIVMLYQLWYSGGVTEGVRNAAKLDRPSGSLKVTSGQITGRKGGASRTDAEAEYRVAGREYFQKRTPQELQSFFSRLAGIVGLTGGR